MTTEEDRFEDCVQNLENKLAGALAENGESWLRTLYEHYTQTFLSDNARIWGTGSIMIPLALAPFVVLPTIASPTVFHLLVLAFASSSLMISWLVIAENHRAFQEKSRAWLVAIERIIGLRDTGPLKIRQRGLNSILTSTGAIQVVRWGLALPTVLAWILIVVFWPTATPQVV